MTCRVPFNIGNLGKIESWVAPVDAIATRLTSLEARFAAIESLQASYLARIVELESGVIPAPTLGTLTLSGALQVGVSTTGTVSGRTPGSTLSGIAGLTFAGASYSGTPTQAGANTLVESLFGAIGSPKSTTITVAAANAPTINFTNPSATVAEGNSGTQTVNNTINAVRNGATGDLTVNLTYSGTATAGSDYVASPSSVTIPSGSNSVSFSTTINGDTAVEPDETIIITATLSGYGVSATKTITITNDDAPASGSNVGPRLTAQSSPTSYPPMPTMTTTPYQVVGDKLRVQAAATYSDLIAGTNLLINDASFSLTDNATTNQNGLRAVLANISTGNTYFYVRSEPISGAAPSLWSNGILHGTAIVPTIVQAGPFTNVSTFKLAQSLTLTDPGKIVLGGDDATRFNTQGVQGGTSYTLIWANDGTELYTPANDANRDHAYELSITVEGWNGKTATYNRTVNLSDFDAVPDAFTFTATGDAPLNSTQTSNTITLAGMDPAAVVAVTVANGSSSKNGGAFTTADKTGSNGDTFAVRGVAGTAMDQTTAVVLTAGGVSGTYYIYTPAALTNGFDPAGSVYSFSNSNRTATRTVDGGTGITRSSIGLTSGGARGFEISYANTNGGLELIGLTSNATLEGNHTSNAMDRWAKAHVDAYFADGNYVGGSGQSFTDGLVGLIYSPDDNTILIDTNDGQGMRLIPGAWDKSIPMFPFGLVSAAGASMTINLKGPFVLASLASITPWSTS